MLFTSVYCKSQLKEGQWRQSQKYYQPYFLVWSVPLKAPINSLEITISFPTIRIILICSFQVCYYVNFQRSVCPSLTWPIEQQFRETFLHKHPVFQKLIFKSKSNKNSVKDASKNKKKKKNKQSAAEKDLEDSKILDDGEKVVKESRNVQENKGNEEETVKETEVETVCKEAEAPCEVDGE